MKYILEAIFGLSYLCLAFATSMVGYTIHGKLLWSIVDFILCPFTLMKWLAYHEINLTIIRATFDFFFK